MIYNLHHDAAAAIVSDTRRIIQETIARMGSRALLLDLPRVTRPTAEMWNDAELHLLLRRG